MIFAIRMSLSTFDEYKFSIKVQNLIGFIFYNVLVAEGPSNN